MNKRNRIHAEILDVMFSFRLTKTELAETKVKAEAAGMKAGTYGRYCLNNSVIKSTVVFRRQRNAYAKLTQLRCLIVEYKEANLDPEYLESFLDNVEMMIANIQADICE